jgi:hypothetical protein
MTTIAPIEIEPLAEAWDDLLEDEAAAVLLSDVDAPNPVLVRELE